MHIEMVIALLNQGNDAHENTNLPDALSREHKKQLKKHFEAITKVPSCVARHGQPAPQTRAGGKQLVLVITNLCSELVLSLAILLAPPRTPALSSASWREQKFVATRPGNHKNANSVRRRA